MSQPPSAPAPRRSRLGPLQRRLLQLVVGLGVLMLADTLYLLASRAAGALGIDYFAVTDLSLPRFYQSMVLWHTVGGIVLVILALFAPAAGCRRRCSSAGRSPCLAAVSRTTVANGCIWIVPGSHRRGLLEHRFSEVERTRVAEVDEKDAVPSGPITS